MTKPIHTCEFESGNCKLCGAFERPRKDRSIEQSITSITYGQMDRLISEINSISWTLFAIAFLIVVITVKVIFL